MKLKLKDLREDKDMLQKEIASYLKITQQQYSRYELEIRTIPIDLLNRLAELYDTSIDYIVGRTNEKKPYPRNK